MKFSLPTSVTTKVGRQILLGKKHSPTLLFAGGITLGVATVVSACKSTLQVEDILLEMQKDLDVVNTIHEAKPEKYSDKQNKQAKAYIYLRGTSRLAKLYGPAFVMGVTSIAMLTGSHRILNSRNASITAAYAAVDKAFGQYRERVVGELGEDKDREFRYGVEEVTVIEEGANGPKKVKKKIHGDKAGYSMYSRFFGRGNINWEPVNDHNIMFLRCVQADATRILQSRGHLFLNEVYDLLGIERTPEGQAVGWVVGNGDGYVDFKIWDDASMERFHAFVTGREEEILLDFNVDGPVWDLIGKKKENA